MSWMCSKTYNAKDEKIGNMEIYITSFDKDINEFIIFFKFRILKFLQNM